MASHQLRIVLAQLNLRAGDISGNLQKIINAAHAARDQQGADLIVFPELSITGYPPEDLLLRRSFITESEIGLEKIIAEIKDIYCLIGHPQTSKKGLYNACSLIYNHKIFGQYQKKHLPNYGVFDEYRYFIPGGDTCVVTIKDIPVGLVICEDLWHDQPVQDAVNKGAKLILSPNASPFEIDKHERRVRVLSTKAKKHKTAIVYVNQIGGQDELIFDGGSMVIDAQGTLCHLAPFFVEDSLLINLEKNLKIACSEIQVPSAEEKIYRALVLSLQDYCKKNNILGAILGVSGGIDSALTLAIAVDALGADSVKAIIMPSRHTSKLSMTEAKTITENFNVETLTIPIEPMYQSFLDNLAPGVAEEKLGVSAQNIQARCRCIILMSLSNQSGFIVLATSNRSELAVGYSTLYGDMVGGFAPLKDVNKTLVYQLAKYRNQISPNIPLQTINRAPTAELAPDQKDEDSLPPYSILDQILEAYLNQGQSCEEIIESGFDSDVVYKVIGLIRKNQYKRYQSPLGPHINYKSFGKEWRYPVTNGFKEELDNRLVLNARDDFD